MDPMSMVIVLLCLIFLALTMPQLARFLVYCALGLALFFAFFTALFFLAGAIGSAFLYLGAQ